MDTALEESCRDRPGRCVGTVAAVADGMQKHHWCMRAGGGGGEAKEQQIRRQAGRAELGCEG